MTKNLQLISGLDHSLFLKGSAKSDVYLYLELKAAKVEQSTKRLPLNLGVVIDRSGSMAGDKIEFARQAVKFIINNLNSDDTMSLVQYDDQIDILFPAGKVTHKQNLLAIVDQIKARNMTNLSGGMMEGFNQTRMQLTKGQINRVLLLSDGLANRGVRHPEQIKKLAIEAYREYGITMSTFGIGADFNEDLMTGLAEVTGGQQYFIGLPEDIPNIFATELQDLLAVVAQNTRIRITYPSEYLKLSRSFGNPVEEAVGQVSLRFQDVFSEDRKSNLFKFTLKKPLDQDAKFEISVEFDDVMTEMKRKEFHHTEILLLSENNADVEQSADRKVLEQIAVFEANAQHKELIRLVEARRYQEAKVAAKQVIAYIEGQLLHFPESEELKNQLEATKQLFQEIDEYRSMSVQEQAMTTKHYKSSASYLAMKRPDRYQQRDLMRAREKRRIRRRDDEKK